MIRQTLTLNKSALFTKSQLATALIFAEALISVCTNTLIATILGFGYIEDCGFLMSPFVNNILFYLFVFKSRLNYESGFCSKSSTEAAYFLYIEVVIMINIQIFDYIDSDHLDSLWYGGHVATVTHGDILISLYANGDVYAHLCSVDDSGAYSIYVKDKNNAGEFYGEMRSKIRNDDELHHALHFDELSLDSGNWWEIFVEYRGKDIDIGDGAVLNADSMNEAISEIIGMLDWIEDYCKGGDNNGVRDR